MKGEGLGGGRGPAVTLTNRMLTITLQPPSVPVQPPAVTASATPQRGAVPCP